jgi:putative endopeptidase
MKRFLTFTAMALISLSAVAQQKSGSGTATASKLVDTAAMDTTADPCADFYQYACGGWRKANPVPPDRTSWNRYGEMAERNRALMHEILEEVSKPGAKRDAVSAQVGDYYAACMDEATINAAGKKPIEARLAEIDALKTRTDLVKEVAAFHRDNISAIFRFTASPDPHNAKMVLADIDQGGLGLPDRDDYFKTDAKSVEKRAKYLEHVQKMFELLGDGPEKAAANAQTVMNLETGLAKPSMDRVSRREPKNLDHRMKLAEVNTMAPNFELATYLKAAGAPTFTELNVSSPKFFQEVNSQLNGNIDDWKTYLRWRVVRFAAPWLSKEFADESFRFNLAYLRGAKEQEVRWKKCTASTDNSMGEALGELFVKKNFSPEGKARMQELIRQVKVQIAESIKNSDWMSEGTKKKALEKLQYIRSQKIAYPDKPKDYRAAKVTRNDMIGNVWRLNALESKHDLAKIGKPVDLTEWGMSAPTVNAYYDPQFSEVVFPAGMLQPPMFSADYDDARNFGAVGRVAGHELSHGFDDEGRKFDKDGNLTDWWTEEDGRKFDERASCVEKQYGEYVALTDPKTGEVVKLNGKLTLGENIADVGGVRMAYLAYRAATKGKGEDKVEGFTPDQRFFLSYAGSRCENLTDQTARLLAQTDPHSPGKYRLIGAVSNMPEFWAAFGCKKGQPMVRENACKIW